MKTKLPISTISYNTPEYLELKLRELQRGKIISEWHFVEHQPEDDEGGKKLHIHLWLQPAKSLQTEDLIEELLQPDPEKPDKPRKCLPFRISKTFGDWYLYAIHDRAYLASKAESRRYHYTIDDVRTSDDDQLNCRVHEIDMLDKGGWAKMEAFYKEGLTFAEIFKRGAVPIQQFSQFRQAYEYMVAERTNRGGRKGHEQPEDGELLTPEQVHDVLTGKARLEDIVTMAQVEEKLRKHGVMKDE